MKLDKQQIVIDLKKKKWITVIFCPTTWTGSRRQHRKTAAAAAHSYIYSSKETRALLPRIINFERMTNKFEQMSICKMDSIFISISICKCNITLFKNTDGFLTLDWLDSGKKCVAFICVSIRMNIHLRKMYVSKWICTSFVHIVCIHRKILVVLFYHIFWTFIMRIHFSQCNHLLLFVFVLWFIECNCKTNSAMTHFNWISDFFLYNYYISFLSIYFRYHARSFDTIKRLLHRWKLYVSQQLYLLRQIKSIKTAYKRIKKNNTLLLSVMKARLIAVISSSSAGASHT